MSSLPFETIKVPEKPTYLAPDGSEIRLLPRMHHASFAHCILPKNRVSKATHHRTVDEFWYFTAGQGEVWRKQGKREETLKVSSGVSLTIPQGTHFQFRNTGNAPLEFVIASMPPWPIPHNNETVEVTGNWPSPK
jgi:mannose-6-phosphate isomerase-like protein (cupin superfamily)